MPVSYQRVRDGLSAFGAITTWMGTVIVPILLFVYAQRIESKIDQQRRLEEQKHLADENLARSTSLLANVAPLLFSNDMTTVTFALQVLAPGDAQIPVQIHPLLLEVVTLYKQKNPELSDLAGSILATKLTPTQIEEANKHIPQNFVIIAGGSAASTVAPSSPAQSTTTAKPPPENNSRPAVEAAPAPVADVAAVTQDILSGSYNVIVASAETEAEAIAMTKDAAAKLQAKGGSLQACWKQPIAPSRYFGVVVGNGVTLADAQKKLIAAREAGFADVYLRQIKGQPSKCTAT